MLVRGASGTSGDGTVGLGRPRGRCHGAARRRGAGRAAVGAAPAEVTHAVVAVDVAGVDGSLEQGPFGAASDRHVGATGRLEDEQRVAHDIVDGRVAADAGDGPQVEGGVQGGEEQRARVVDSGVDVEHDGSGIGRHSGNVPVRAACLTVPLPLDAPHRGTSPATTPAEDRLERCARAPADAVTTARLPAAVLVAAATMARPPAPRRRRPPPPPSVGTPPRPRPRAPDDAGHDASRDERGADDEHRPPPPASCAASYRRRHGRRRACRPAAHGRPRPRRQPHEPRRPRHPAVTSAASSSSVAGRGGVDSVRATTRHLAALASKADTAGLGLLLAADQEGGAVQQLRGAGFSRMPSARVQDQGSPAP